MFKALTLLTLLAVVFSINFPLYKQCDSQWANQQLGTSSNTICKAGCLVSSAAMALSGTGHSFNPSTLNKWLKANKGYVSGDSFVWGSINSFGLIYQEKVPNVLIKPNLDCGKVVIINVRNGAHWVLAHGYSGNSILVNDPGYATTSYDLSQIVEGNNAIYTVKSAKGVMGKLKALLRIEQQETSLTQEADGGTLSDQQ